MLIVPSRPRYLTRSVGSLLSYHACLTRSTYVADVVYYDPSSRGGKACEAIGPSMVAILKEVYGRAKGADKFLMSQQPALKYS